MEHEAIAESNPADDAESTKSLVGKNPQYDSFASEFLDHASEGFFNAHYDRPACLELLGDVAENVFSTPRVVPVSTPKNW